MTRTAAARLAGTMFLLYIAVGITSMAISGRAMRGDGAAAKLDAIARNAETVRVTVLLDFSTFFIAVALAVALWALTRDVDRELALMALLFRAGEGTIAAAATVKSLALVSVATDSLAATGAQGAAAVAAGSALLKQGGLSGLVGATCFAAGSTLFAYLFLRGRSIPAALAWLGIGASALLDVTLPLQILARLPKWAEWPMWMPMLVFEVSLALWLLVKGTRAERT